MVFDMGAFDNVRTANSQKLVKLAKEQHKETDDLVQIAKRQLKEQTETNELLRQLIQAQSRH